MSLRDIISKASLRVVIALSAFFSLLAMVIYIVIISVKIGWLFGRQGAR
jgi:hypothetical protein